MLLNVSVFIWFGTIAPWPEFGHNSSIPVYRLIPLGILVLLLRRLPVIMAMHKKIHQIEEFRQALFVGFFGPIGVSAIFYLYVSLEFLHQVTGPDGEERGDAKELAEAMYVVVWFLVICSIVRLLQIHARSHLDAHHISPGCPRAQRSAGQARFLPAADHLTSHQLRTSGP
jgi:sodium/hydrogen antiporter